MGEGRIEEAVDVDVLLDDGVVAFVIFSTGEISEGSYQRSLALCCQPVGSCSCSITLVARHIIHGFTRRPIWYWEMEALTLASSLLSTHPQSSSTGPNCIWDCCSLSSACSSYADYSRPGWPSSHAPGHLHLCRDGSAILLAILRVLCPRLVIAVHGHERLRSAFSICEVKCWIVSELEYSRRHCYARPKASHRRTAGILSIVNLRQNHRSLKQPSDV